MLAQYLQELTVGVPVAYPLHRAAATGDFAAASSIVASYATDRNNKHVNEPDETGNSAIFYAQLAGHDSIVAMLAAHGWEKMPEGNIFVGAGGRRCFWSYGGPAGKPRHVGTPAAAPARFIEVPMAQASHASQKKKTVALRQLWRRSELRDQTTNSTRRSLFMPKAVGSTRATRGSRRPTLNVRDHWDRCHLGDDVSDTEEEDQEENARGEVLAVEGDGNEDVHSLAHVARFVVARRPTQHIDDAGNTTWVVVPPADVEEDAVVPLDPADDVISLASFATDAEDVEWPALPASSARRVEVAGMEGLDTSLEDVQETEWEVLDDDDDDDENADKAGDAMCIDASPAAPAPQTSGGSAWRGAEATRAAIGAVVAPQQPSTQARLHKHASLTNDVQLHEPSTVGREGLAGAVEEAMPPMDVSAGLKDAGHRMERNKKRR